ncbi:MAG TPA: tRNA uracil 4-sulfurtransferase ThiI, partial [Erysipelothrix sp.]|nr:tRNA uracil 4-sulfurtransferase ThiI [Erysipelothrix sp.]
MYNYDHILVRYGELSTKGKNRRDFTNLLVKNIKTKLNNFENLSYDKRFDRLFIHLNGEDGLAVSELLKDVFGLSSFSLAIKVERDLDKLAEVAYHFIRKETKSTFKVLTRRHDKSFEHNSDSINRHVAGHILRNTEFKVDVHHPEVKIIIEIRKEAAYLTLNKIEGLGGYPVGIQGKVLMMLSGGIDSPVASYLMMKRGVEIETIHFQSPPYTSQGALDKVLNLARTLTKYQNTIKVHVVNFTDIQLDIYNKVPESYAITMMRRFFLRIGNEVAKKRKIIAIGNGENLGQVASQTLESIEAITKFDTIPVLR